MARPAEGVLYEWDVNGHVQGYGPAIDVMFTTTGENAVTLIKTNMDGLATSVTVSHSRCRSPV